MKLLVQGLVSLGEQEALGRVSTARCSGTCVGQAVLEQGACYQPEQGEEGDERPAFIGFHQL